MRKEGGAVGGRVAESPSADGHLGCVTCTMNFFFFNKKETMVLSCNNVSPRLNPCPL